MDISMIDMSGWGPDIMQPVQTEIQNRKITYPEIATRVHMASGTVASWFSRGAIPADKLFGVAAAIGGAKIWMQVLSKLPGNSFHTQYLDKTDNSPLAATEDLIDAMESALKTAADYKRITRHKKSDFTEDELAAINRFLDDSADVRLFSQMLHVRSKEAFGISTKGIMDRQTVRMQEKGYCRQRKNRLRLHTDGFKNLIKLSKKSIARCPKLVNKEK
jgi:hypothetical protein